MLQKNAIDISFAQGLDQKTDPKRVQMGKFVKLQNTVFNKGGRLEKRNGYSKLASLPDTTYSSVTTFNEDLTAIGPNIAAYNTANNSWVQKGTIHPLSISTLPLIRNNLNQTACDSAVAPNGVVCTAYLETDGSTITNKYVIADSVTGQNLVAPTAIPVASGTVSGGMRVFVLGNNFIIVFTNTITATAHLQYITINSNNPSVVGANTDIAAAYIAATTLAWDGYVWGNKLFLAYNTTSGGQSVVVTYLTNSAANLHQSPTSTTVFAARTATMVSVTVDSTNAINPTVYVSFYDSSSSTGFIAAVDQNLNRIMNPVKIIGAITVLNITSAAQNGSCKVFAEISNVYSGSSGLATNYISAVTVTPLVTTFKSVFSTGAGTITVSSATGLVNGMYLVDETTPANIAAGTTFTISGTTLTLSINTAGNSASSPGDTLTAATVSSAVVIIRSVGLASKAFIINDIIYFLSAYSSLYQPTYFLINGSTSTSASPKIAAKLAYSNGGGYLTKGLPGVSIDDTTVKIPYLFKDLIQAVNKNTDVPTGTQVNGIYSQTGINLATYSFGTSGLDTAEIGNDLHLTGGFLSMYDGYLPVEHNFFLWPDLNQGTVTDAWAWSATGGSIAAQPDGSTNANVYFYQYAYEWTDNQGNAFRSAPSIPIAITTTGNLTTGSITLKIATLRLTMKVANPVKIVIYRWSIAQQNYYQVTSITSPTLNSTTADSITFVDTLSDATILGNNLIYTTGGVIEDVNAPASDIVTLFDTRLWLVNAEDPNVLWYSKQVIEATPVEMSDLFTVFVPPTTATQGSTGPITSLAPLDDKLIIGKRNAFLYINGTGPDNTGANNQYSQPIFITATVGCSNQKSIVLMPQGLMFQSDKGIWLLDRGLNTTYIGKDVEDFTLGANVVSAVNIPETNQVRFNLDSGVTLMYDYFYAQWGTFVGVPAISSCIFEHLHSFINQYGEVYQENPGTYQDGSNPVLINFKTGPIRLGDASGTTRVDNIQAYMRVYFFYLIGTYLSPHKLLVSISYDYEASPSQTVIITPDNYSTPYGSGLSQSPFGQGTPFGGPLTLENWKVSLERQRCMAFAIEIQEVFDPSFDTAPGAGLTLSGLNIVMGFKKGFRPQETAKTAG